MSGTVVDAFGTGLLDTTVTALPGGGHRWLRRPGPASADGFTPLADRLREAVGAVPAGAPVRPLLGRPAPDGARIYDAPGRHSAAHWLITGGGPHAAPGGARALADVLRGVGALLAALHRQPVPDEARRPSRAAVRLHRWLSGRTTAAGATPADLLGAEAVGPLRAWAAEAVQPSDGHVLSHGAPGLGALVLPGPDGTPDGPAALLTGEDLCAAPPHLDLGWMVGELVELRWLMGCATEPRDWQQPVDALLDGYGSGHAAGPAARARESHLRGGALRIALHAHDTAAYLPDSVGQARLYGVLATAFTKEAAA
ncbi:hypothetical protein [Streptomyces sp. 2P-4]|uniref:hypothetical protein n=1 Tax=Streptomyces sp. 2P-4 TaxID=2931974 RepID=UPI0025404DF2|nr:hypothetical protein [Streptomyces sp. 2P-4]